MTRRSFHSVVELPIEGPIAGQSIPALFLQEGELSIYTLSWVRNMMNSYSPMHLFKCVNAVGLLYDFYLENYGGKPLAQNEMPILMRNFFEARAYGNKTLGWNPVGKKTARDDVRYASEFSKFCSNNFGTYQINPTEKRLLKDLNVSDQLQYYANMNQRKNWNLLDHLTPTTEFGKGIISGFSYRPDPERVATKEIYNYFPPDKVLDFIASTDNLRDQLVFLLLFFGGFRESEPLHFYINDITTPNGEAEIRVSHPALADYSWEDPFRGKRHGNRFQFLADRYGLTPRNQLGLKNPFHAGWKGMMYTKKKYEAGVHWLLPEIGRLFAKLHRRYLHEYRTGIPDSNPYYFVNFQGEHFGTPLKISNLTKSFCRAARKVGLNPYSPGISPHGARHFYGHFCASYLKVPIEQAQIMLRHAKISSTQVYYSIDERIIRDELIKGYEKMKSEIPNFIKDVNKLASREM